MEDYGTPPTDDAPTNKKAVERQKVSFKEARQLVSSSEQRDQKLREHVATMRHLYRTGRLDTDLTVHDLDRALWERTDYRSDLEAVNLACSYINIIVATTAARSPVITAEPSFVTPETTQAADGIAALIRTFLEQDDALGTSRRVGLDASISGDGFAHVQWAFEEVDIDPEERKELIAEARREYFALALEEGDDPNPPDGFDDQIPKTRVVKNRPTLSYVSPIDVLLPSHISEVRDTPWYAIRSVQRVQDIKANPIYDKAALEQLSPEREEAEDPARRLDNRDGFQKEELATLYTFYDVLNHRMLVFAKGGGKALYEGENPNDFSDLCLVHLRGYRDGEHVRGFGDLALVAGLMDKLNFVVRQQLDNLERQGTVFVTREDVLTDEDRRNLEMARPGDVVVARGLPDGVRLADVIEAFPVQALSADVYQARQQLQEDIGKVLGLSDFQIGGLGPSRMSGTAAAVADGVATLRAQQRLEAYEEFYRQVANLFYKFCQQYLSEDQVVKIVGPDGSLFQETIDAENLTNDYFIRVKTGSMAAVNPATRAQRGAELLNLADRLEQGGYDADALRRYALREMGIDPELMGIRKNLPPQLDPMSGAPAGAPGAPMPPEMGLPPGSPQAEMMEMGGPPMGGADGMPLM